MGGTHATTSPSRTKAVPPKMRSARFTVRRFCYPGICDTPASTNPKVDIFVKRLPATSGNTETASNVWLLQGGPGYSSTAKRYDKPTPTVRRQCECVHDGPPRHWTQHIVGLCSGTNRDYWFSARKNHCHPSEVPACAQDLHTKYGDLASFSVTATATDLKTFISKHTNGASTIVYGLSYGTMLVERLIHLAPPEVTGYVLDSVCTVSGQFSNYDVNIKEAHFEPDGLNGTLEGLLQKFDNNPNSTCGTLIRKVSLGESGEPASYILRLALGNLLKDPYMRGLIPPVVYRLNRCAPEDIDVLKQFVKRLNHHFDYQTQDDASTSTLLYGLVVYSELWEMPAPSMSELHARFTNTLLSDGAVYTINPLYCAFSKEKSTACGEFGYMGNYEASAIIYERDLSTGTRVPRSQTMQMFAEYLLGSLNGDKKNLIALDYAAHAVLVSTPLDADDPCSETCGSKLLASYMPAFNMTPPQDYQYAYFGSDDPYDGVYNASLVPE
ncbi:hypothetical protein ON010_g17793 [Phytophthora cinnamomi]|nr:hypothetical protein ON010_g17793 [Phytophthora cinnamomi]